MLSISGRFSTVFELGRLARLLGVKEARDLEPYVRYLLFICLLYTLGAWATELTDVQQLAKRYPPGSITTRELADRALSDASSIHSQLEREFTAQRLHCEHVFFVNHCMGEAHRVQRTGETEIRRITLEAHDLQRHLDARDRAQAREAELRREATEELQRPERERQAMQAAQSRQQGAQTRAEDALRTQQNAEQASRASEQRQRDQEAELARKDALRPQQEAESLHEFQQKQEQAGSYAQTRARDREANAKRRAEREAAREQQYAPPSAQPPAR